MMAPNAMPAVEAPLWDEPEFTAVVEGLVADFAPRLFALVEEEGERVDGHIVAWGMAFEDHAEVVWADGEARGSFSSAEAARWMFSLSAKVRLVWCNPDAAHALTRRLDPSSRDRR